MKETKDFILVEFVSQKGNKFEVGYPKSGGYTKKMLEVELKKSEDSLAGCSNNWKDILLPVDKNGTISSDAEEIGIKSGNVTSNHPSALYSYTLKFVNTTGWGFYFKDKTGDIYHCSTILNSSHTIFYNSDKPTMISVSD